MRCISCEEDSAFSHAIDTSIVDAELIGLCYIIIFRFWVARKKLFKSSFASFNIFFVRKSWGVAIGYSPEASYFSLCD